MVLAILGSILFAITANCFRKLESIHYMTLTHLFSFILVIFIPIFFPMEGVTSPSIQDWVVLLVIGFLLYLTFLCLIRAFQIEASGKVLSVFTLPLVGVVIADFFLASDLGNIFWGIVGSVLIITGVVMLMNETKEKIALGNTDMKQKKFLQDENDDY